MSRPAVRLITDRLPAGPWIYGRQVAPAPDVPDGSLVEVEDDSGRFVGHGLYNGRSDIRVRMLSRGRKTDLDRPEQFLREKLAAASRLRRKVLRIPEVADAYRLCHAEGDDLPGLVVDRLGSAFVVQHHALGFWRLREEVEQALRALDGDATVVHRVPATALRQEGMDEREVPEPEPQETIWIEEHGLRYPVVPGQGHKTGWFCDQRENRLHVGRLGAGRGVLDLCTNGGGFALQAARHGARKVIAVDLDEQVLERARAAAAFNELEVEFVHADAFHVLRATKDQERRPGLVVLDPHKLIPGKARLEEGRAKYLDLNTLGLQAVAPGGLLATFSCSGALDLPSFLGMLFQAGRRAERGLKVLELLGAGPDHPQRPEFPRSRYLKGALLAVD